jgi:hypothetical protein
MMAKASAKQSGATFINIATTVLTNEWYGESNQLVAGLLSLARKTIPRSSSSTRSTHPCSKLFNNLFTFFGILHHAP